MSATTKIRLWFIRETELARLYSKTPLVPGSGGCERDQVELWIPKSIIEHTSKDPTGLHIVTLPDWFAEKEGL